MDNSTRKKITINWLRTASPMLVRSSDAGLPSRSGWSVSPHEDSDALPLRDSPGPEDFAGLSLDSPKRKAPMSSLAKQKLRKLSKTTFETFLSSEVNLVCTVMANDRFSHVLTSFLFAF